VAIFGKKSKQKRALRIFFASDLHGSNRCYRKFLAAAGVYEADVLIIGGDFAGKGLVPILEKDGMLSATVRGKTVEMPAEREDDLLAEINRFGYYARRMTPEEIETIDGDPIAIEHYFQLEMTRQLTQWGELARDRLPEQTRVIITPGNDDPSEMDAVLRNAPKVECPSNDWTNLGPFAMVSFPYVSPTPWDTEREMPEDKMAARIDELMLQAPTDRPVIMNLHCPPYGTGLDNAPELDENLRPVIRGGRPSVIPVGSTAVRDAIKKYQPALSLHGHIHESRAVQKIGATLSINPGSDYTADLLRGAVVDLADDGTVLDFLLTAG
jgi:Icc-related predicted phosphoesterase